MQKSPATGDFLYVAEYYVWHNTLIFGVFRAKNGKSGAFLRIADRAHDDGGDHEKAPRNEVINGVDDEEAHDQE